MKFNIKGKDFAFDLKAEQKIPTDDKYETVPVNANIAKCPVCEDMLYSKYRHDYMVCLCGDTMIDGGRSYFRSYGTPIYLKTLLKCNG
jgi:hypothetical protein